MMMILPVKALKALPYSDDTTQRHDKEKRNLSCRCACHTDTTKMCCAHNDTTTSCVANHAILRRHGNCVVSSACVVRGIKKMIPPNDTKNCRRRHMCRRPEIHVSCRVSCRMSCRKVCQTQTTRHDLFCRADDTCMSCRWSMACKTTRQHDNYRVVVSCRRSMGAP